MTEFLFDIARDGKINTHFYGWMEKWIVLLGNASRKVGHCVMVVRNHEISLFVHTLDGRKDAANKAKSVRPDNTQ